MTDSDEIVIGDLKIAESVVTRMIRESAAAIDGVAQVREANVVPKDGTLGVEVSLVVGYKTIFPDVAASVQTAITDDINRTTGIKVSEVNVMVERLDFSKD